MKIFSPVAYGSGSFIIHEALEKNIEGYELKKYNPYLTLFPPFLTRLRKKEADIVHAPVDYACFLRNKETPLVSTVHGYMLDDDFVSKVGLIRKLHYKTDLKYFFKKSISQSNKIVCVSEYLKKKIIQNYGNEDKIEVIHNGVDTDQFKPKINKNKRINKITILFVGNIKKSKGVDIFPKLLDILGEKFELIYTEGLKKSSNLIKHSNARCVGKVNHEDMPELYSSVDLLVSASIREGFGLAIAEAMSCGLPIIAPNNSAIPELVDDSKSGYLCEDIEAGNYAKKITMLFDSDGKRNDIAEYNREKIVREFNLRKMVKTYRLLFEKIIN